MIYFVGMMFMMGIVWAYEEENDPFWAMLVPVLLWPVALGFMIAKRCDKIEKKIETKGE